MKFKKELYHYQIDILNVFENEVSRWDKKIHIVAPPWSGKTIVWLEMMTRLKNNTLILVPNLTLQEQWKDKLEKFFLEDWEKIEELVSTDPNLIKKINIITYQSLTQTWDENDMVNQKILENWYNDFKEEFDTREEFDTYIISLKENNIWEYSELFSKYKKWVKLNSDSDMIDNLLSDKVKNFFANLKEYNIGTIIVDEAHHLTSWWSRVIFYLWNYLSNPFIIWLTATPPFDNADFFDLNDDYSNLLWEVDYYIPTPAIIKSWRLAPYNDLVYFVKPDETLNNILKQKEQILKEFLIKENKNISNTIYQILEKDYEKLEKNSQEILNSYLRFIYNFTKELDISNYINESTTDILNLEDIAKATWKWLITQKIKENNWVDWDKIKKIFFDLWYIWRWNNFYRFQTPIEKLLIYSKTKINWVKDILNKEISNLWNNLKCAIITDFLSQESDYINCEYIFEELLNEYKNLNPYLVSGQWIWKIWQDWNKMQVLDETIVWITKKLELWEAKLLIWTRWILWEWWDCPKLNTLIDITWVMAYMSVNQVRWRAIRLDTDNLKKCSNVYDIVCIWEWFQWLKDYRRLEWKHEKFYWVNDAWIIVKWVDHVYPNLESHLKDYKKINENMLFRSSLRDVIYWYWWIWWEYSNKEIFGLHLEINNAFSIFPYAKTSIFSLFKLIKVFSKETKLKEIANSYYFVIVYNFLSDFISDITNTLIDNKILPEDFEYELNKDNYWNVQIISKYKDELLSKWYITYLSSIFSPTTSQKYILSMKSWIIENGVLWESKIYFPLPEVLSKNKEYRENFLDYLAPYDSKNKIRKKKKGPNILSSPWYFAITILWAVIWFLNFLVDSNYSYEIMLLLKIIIFWPIIFFIFINFIILLIKIIQKMAKIVTFLNYILSKLNFYNYYLLANKKKLRKDFDFIFLNSIDIDKKDYIWKIPFITSKIEKLWI